MSLQVLKQMIPILSAQILGLSLASPESVLSWGVAGVAKHAALMALLYTAVGAAEGSVKKGIKKRREKANPSGYESGGYTQGEGLYVAGEKGKKEWISPSWMLTNPTTAPVIQWLEAFRSKPISVSSQALKATKNTLAATSYSPVFPSQPGTASQKPTNTNPFPSYDALQSLLKKQTQVLERLMEWEIPISDVRKKIAKAELRDKQSKLE